jgi:hypothetical protein
VYFVTMKRAGYCLFATTPSERFAVGLLDDQQRLQVLEREGGDYVMRHEWPVSELSHTDVMRRLGAVPEPGSLAAFVDTARGR